MAGTKSDGKRSVGRRSRKSIEKVLRGKEQDGTENQSVGNDEDGETPFGFPGLDTARSDMILGLFINSLAFSTSQGLMSGIDKESAANIGLGYFIKLYDALLSDKTMDEKRKFLSEVVDLYLLTVASTEGGVS